jgi:hypothetical protein
MGHGPPEYLHPLFVIRPDGREVPCAFVVEAGDVRVILPDGSAVSAPLFGSNPEVLAEILAQAALDDQELQRSGR